MRSSDRVICTEAAGRAVMRMSHSLTHPSVAPARPQGHTLEDADHPPGR